MDNVDLTIALVNHNMRKLLRGCLNSVYQSTTGVRFEAVVVDNHSTDGSIKMLSTEFPQVKLIENEKNLGFARANNQAVRQSRGKYLLLLNPDTLFQNNSLQKMIAFMEDHCEAGALGCKVLNPNGTIQPSNDNFPTLFTELFRVIQLKRLIPRARMRAKIGQRWGKMLGSTLGGYLRIYWDTNRIREVDWITGAFFLIRRKAIEEVGLLDEAFFMYYEDADWCYRLRQKGWKIFYFPLFEIIHYGESSSKFSPHTFIERHKSMQYFFNKHRGKKAVFMLRLIICGGLALRWVGLLVIYPFSRDRREELRKRIFAYLRVIGMKDFKPGDKVHFMFWFNFL